MLQYNLIWSFFFLAKRIWESASPKTRIALKAYLEKEVGNAKKKIKVATDNLAEMMRSGLTQNEAIHVGTILNRIPGIKMSPKYRNKLSGMLHEVDDYFDVRQLQLLQKAKNEEEDYDGPDVLAQDEYRFVVLKIFKRKTTTTITTNKLQWNQEWQKIFINITDIWRSEDVANQN